MNLHTSKILAFDTGGVTGWAVLEIGGEPKFGSFALPTTNNDGHYFHRFCSHVADLITTHGPSVIAYEAPIISKNASHFKTVHRLINLIGNLQRISYVRDIKHLMSFQSKTAKKILTGHGGAEKGQMIEEVRRRGWAVTDDHQADAVAIALCAEAKIAPHLSRAHGTILAG